ncbi:MAG: TraB/GumN family protein [Bacteroidetes bacterium]|nr:TraB/GumN family protein [Bacteroidota bacterium]
MHRSFSRCFSTFVALACLLPVVLPAPAAAQSLLWKIEGKGLTAPSYLYGTIHAICPDDMQITDAITDAIGNTARVALELDLDDPRLVVEMGHFSFMPDDSTLNDLFTKDEFTFLENWFRDSVGMSITPMNNIRPLFLFGLLIGKTLNCTPKSYEEVFMAMARQQGKETIGIETPQEQLAAFGAIPLREQATMVLDMLTHMDSTRAAFRVLTELYKKQDLDALYRFMLDSGIEYGRYDAALLTTRNKAWIPRILEIASEKPTFIAVGAGHFAGEYGILNLLKKEGLRVTPVKN